MHGWIPNSEGETIDNCKPYVVLIKSRRFVEKKDDKNKIKIKKYMVLVGARLEKTHKSC